MMGDVFYTDPYVTVLGAEITVGADVKGECDVTQQEVTLSGDLVLGGEITLGGEIAYQDSLRLREETLVLPANAVNGGSDFDGTLSVQEEETTTSEMPLTAAKSETRERQRLRDVQRQRISVISDRLTDRTNETLAEPQKKTRRRVKSASSGPRKASGEAKSRFCATCGIGFTSGLALRVHRAAHARERNQCPLCDAVFCWNSNLSRHIRYKHTGHKPFTCDVCQAAFSESGNLIRHKKVHSDEKPYQCDICGARHREKFNLKRHKRTHERATPRTNRPIVENVARPAETMIIKCINTCD